MDLGHFLKVSLIYFRRKLLLLDLNNIWLIFNLFSEVGVSKKFTFGDFTDCFIKGSNNCYEAFVSAFKPELDRIVNMDQIPNYSFFENFTNTELFGF